MPEQDVFQVGQRQPSVENVFHQDDVLAFHRLVDILHQLHFPALLLGVAVAGNSDEIEAGVELDLAGKVSKKDRGALQHSDEHHRLTLKIAGDSYAELGDFLGDLFTGEKDFESVQGHPQGAISTELDGRELSGETQLNILRRLLVSCRILEILDFRQSVEAYSMLNRPRRAATVAKVLLLIFFSATTAIAAAKPGASSEAQTERYFESIRKDPNLLVAFLLEMPKGGDLHNHLSGAIYAETMIQWAKDEKQCVDPKTLYLTPSLKLSTGDPYCPAPTVLAETALANPVLYRSMIDAFSMRNWELSGQSGHDHFFDTFDKFGAATHGNTGKMLAETANRAASQREVYQELMFTPTGKPFGDMLNSDAVKAVKLTDDATPETLAAMRSALTQNGLSKAVQDAIQQANDAEKIRDTEMHCGSAGADSGLQGDPALSVSGTAWAAKRNCVRADAARL